MMKDYTNQIVDYIELEKKTLDSLELSEINSVLGELEAVYRREGNVFIFGNGGSAATASHFANDFNKGISEYTEKKFRFQCLNDNVATVMAIANDIGYEDVFAFQLRGRIGADDLVIGISGSGNSKNVLRAIEYANESGVRTIGITGYDGGKLVALAKVSLHVPINNMQITEDIHMMFDHLMMSILKCTLTKKD